MDEILGVIPARGGSKGIPRKNVHPLAGKPLIQYTIEAARKCRVLSRVVVSTDDAEIAELAVNMDLEVLRRPDDLAHDDTPMVPVIHHVVDSLAESGYQPEVIVVLQPTAPLRRTEHIDQCIDLMSKTNANSVVSVSLVPGHFHPDWQFFISESGELQAISGRKLDNLQSRRQDLPRTYTRNGALYVVRREAFIQNVSLLAPPCMAYIMAVEDSVNIDSEEDIWVAERYLLQRQSEIGTG